MAKYWTFLLLGVLITSTVDSFVIDGNVTRAEYGSPLWTPLSTSSSIDWFVANNQSTLVFAVSIPSVTATNFSIIFGLYMNADPVNGPPSDASTTSFTDTLAVVNYPFRIDTVFIVRRAISTVYYSQYSSNNWQANNCDVCRAKFSNSSDQVELAIPISWFQNRRVPNALQFFGSYWTGSSFVNSAPQEYGLIISEQTPVPTSAQYYYNTYPFVKTSTSPTNWYNNNNWAPATRVPSNTSAEMYQSNAIIANCSTILDDDAHVTTLVLTQGSTLDLSVNQLTVGSKDGNTTSIIMMGNSSSIDGTSGTLVLGGPLSVGIGVLQSSIAVNTLKLTYFGPYSGTVLVSSLPINVSQAVYVQKNGINNTILIAYNDSASLIYETGVSGTAGLEWFDDDSFPNFVPPQVTISSGATITKTAEANVGVLSRGLVDVQGTLTALCDNATSLNIQGDLNVDGTLILGCDLYVDGNITAGGNVVCQKSGIYQNFLSFYGSDGVVWYNSTDNSTTADLNYADTIPVGNDGVTVTFPSTSLVYGWQLDNSDVVCVNSSSCFFSVDDTFSASVTASMFAGPNADCYSTFTFHLQDATTTSGNSAKKGLGGGAIAGIVIAVLVIAAAAVGAAFFFLVYKRRNENLDHDEEDADLPDINRSSVASANVASIKRSMSARKTFLREEWEIPYSQLTIGKELGRGAFGVVYKCRWRNTDCVVKQLDINKNDQQSITQFLKEANHVQNLRSHPNVCTVFGVCTNPDFPICIVMEYVPEGSLDILIYQRKILPDAQMVLELGKDIASGMSHLHAENVLHCDLACRNLLVVSRGKNKYQVKIADFGLSRVTETDTYNASTTKTFPVRWTAPETLQSGKLSRASDVWSFGVVLWEIIEGKRPYTDMSNAEIIKAVCDKGYRLPRPDRIPIPDEVYELMTDCWKEDPQQRPTFDAICKRLDALQRKFFPEEDEAVNLPLKNEGELYNNNYNSINNTPNGAPPEKDYYNTGQKTVALPAENNYN